MKTIAVAVIKVIVGIVAAFLAVFALFAAVGMGASHFAATQCGAGTGVLCGLAASIAAWWFFAWMVVAVPLLILSFVLFVRRWSAPGTRGKVAGAICVLWGGGMLVRRFFFQEGIHANHYAQLGANFALVLAAVMLVVAAYFLFRKSGARATP